MVFENLGETGAGKMGALIGVEDVRLAIAAEGFLEGLHTEIRFQGIGKTPGEDLAAVPVHDRHQVHKPAGHGNVGDVGRPHMVGMIDGQIPEQIGVDFMLRMRPTRVRLGIDRLDAHYPHQPLDTLAVDPAALPPEMSGHGTTAVGRCLQVLLIDQPHQLQILGIDRPWDIVERGAAQSQQPALP